MNMVALSCSTYIGQLSLIIMLGLLIIPDIILADTYDQAKASNCDDVAIVGAGIAGTYAAWKLRNTKQKITIYEYSNRVGGRIYTQYFPEAPDIKTDLRAMRLKPAVHVRLLKTIHELGLKTIPFALGNGPYPDTLMYLRNSHFRYKDIGNPMTEVPYDIGDIGNMPLNQLRWKIYSENTDILDNTSASIYEVRSSDGIPLYQQSMQAFLSKNVDSETFQFLKNTYSFDYFFGGISSTMTLPWAEPDPDAPEVEVETVKGGMGRIPSTLLRKFLQQSAKHSLVRNRHLTALQMNKDGNSHMLTFQKAKTDKDGKTTVTNKIERQCAKKVILATNRMALEQLDWDALKKPYFKDIISNAVQDHLAAKIFLAYSEPWWRNTGVDFDYAISDTLLRQTYDFGTSKSSNVSVLNAGYFDGIRVALWDELQKRDSKAAERSVSREMMTVINKILAKICNTTVKSIPKPIGGVAQLWNYYPFGGAWQKLMPGYDWSKIEYTMTKPSVYEDVYLATNAFNARSRSYWAEGALEAVDLVLEHFNVV